MKKKEFKPDQYFVSVGLRSGKTGKILKNESYELEEFFLRAIHMGVGLRKTWWLKLLRKRWVGEIGATAIYNIKWNTKRMIDKDEFGKSTRHQRKGVK